MNEDIMRAVGMGHKVDLFKAGKCTDCEKVVNTNVVCDEFTDELSRKDYKITGMCQACQDSMYNQGAEDE